MTPTTKLHWLPYALIAALAVGGQYVAGVERLQPADFGGHLAIGAVAVGIEAMAVWLSVLARQRARLGENAWLHWGIAAGFALVAVSINIIGHEDLYLRVVFGGFSLAGFVIFVSEQISMVRSAWDPDGSIRSKVPAYGHLRQFESSDAVIKLARRIAQTWAEKNRDAPEGLGPVTVLELARQQISEDERRGRIQRVMRAMYLKRSLTADQVELALLAYNTEAVAARMLADADNTGLAAALMRDIHPDILTAPPPPSGVRRLRRGGVPQQQLMAGDDAAAVEAHDEEVLLGVADLPHITGQGPTAYTLPWFQRTVDYWLSALAEGRQPSNAELVQASGVSLAQLKRHKAAVFLLVTAAYAPGGAGDTARALEAS